MKTTIFNFTKFFTLCAIIAVAVTFSSCGDDNDEPGGGGLSGYYMSTPHDGWDGYQFCEGLHFTGKNTVVYYSYLANGKYWPNELGGSKSFPGKSGWYYQGGSPGTYEYTRDGDKLYLVAQDGSDAQIKFLSNFKKVN